MDNLDNGYYDKREGLQQGQKETNDQELAMLLIKRQVYNGRKANYLRKIKEIKTKFPGIESDKNEVNESHKSAVEKEKIIKPTTIYINPSLMKKMKLKITFSAIILILIITNPTNNDFKNYLQGSYGINVSENNDTNMKYPFGRTKYYFFLSIYKYSELKKEDGEYKIEKSKTYLGIFKNFFQVGEQ